MSFFDWISCLFSFPTKVSDSGGKASLESTIQSTIRKRTEFARNPKRFAEERLSQLKVILNPIIEDIPEKHWSALKRKRDHLMVKDDYGEVDTSAWFSELGRYSAKYILPQISSVHLQIFEDYCITQGMDCRDPITPVVNGFIDNTIEHWDLYFPNNSLSESLYQERPDNPYQYEQYCAQLLRSAGWESYVTKASGDQGGDIRAEMAGLKIVIQCKLYSNPVGNKAVQEVVASVKHYDADYGVVVTNSSYTRSAKFLAKSNNVLLLHDSNLSSLNGADFQSIR